MKASAKSIMDRFSSINPNYKTKTTDYVKKIHKDKSKSKIVNK